MSSAIISNLGSLSSHLTRADVERIAKLAHLELTGDEAELFTRQLAQILKYADHLQDVDTSDVSATWHPLAEAAPPRTDTLQPSLTPAEALANAPAPGPRGLFRVPRVIG